MTSNRTARGSAIRAVAALALAGACKVDDAAERRAEAERPAQVAQAEARMRAAREADERQGDGRMVPHGRRRAWRPPGPA